MTNKTIRFNVKAQWYNMIEQGIKTEEYCEITEYWAKKLFKDLPITWYSTFKLCSNIHRFSPFYNKKIKPIYDTITIVRGISKDSMEFEIEYLSIGEGNKEWGASDGDMFIIKLGKKIN